MTEQSTAARYDMYRLIHKGLRAFMMDSLSAVGAMDSDDEADVAAALAQTRGLLAFCHEHLRHEDGWVHTAMEAREPGSAGHTAGDHAEHAHMFTELEALAAAVESRRGAARADAAHALYQKLALFVGENFVHMSVEESHNNAVLWRTHTDAELAAIEQGIVASQPPEEQALTARWIAAAASPAERAGFLSAVRGAAPPEAFEGLLAMIRPHLRPKDREKLAHALGTAALAA
ncbi:hemerythrin domain-containing protein [Azospirillum sp. SYSU D00513]|uniref:hemerythrin domain-containing protein n=1 Tax=Azospirillum sp. SYSU D00513 TaxID=2812561 RepID=UPI001A97D0AE|nr:hemerythrin domain-containing protein [Azospirillum sp. SYSU D00513]